MKVSGQLIRAQLEVVAGAVSNLIVGRIWYDKTAEKTKVVDSSNASHSVVTEDGTATLTNKTFNADGTGNSITNIENADIKAAAAIALNKLAAATADRALVSDGSGFVSPATTTATEIGYVNGVTSAIQTQLDAKQARSTLTTKGDLYVATASATVARQAIGTDAQVLTADSAQTNGLKWATPASAPDQSYEISNLGLAASVAANALTIALKDKSGSDPSAGSPVKVGFRHATITTGQYTQVSTTGALSVVVSSGSTLGHASAVENYIYVYLINNAGTAELAVSTARYDEGAVVTTTTEGGAGGADSATSIYSTTGRSNVPVRLIGMLKSTQATAGTWASAITSIHLIPFPADSQSTQFIQYTTLAGHGSVATHIPYFSNADENTTSGNTLLDVGNDSTNGFKVTARRRCIVSMTFQAIFTGTGEHLGISRNASSTSTAIASITTTGIMGYTDDGGRGKSHSATTILNPGDILRPHATSGNAGATGGWRVIVCARGF